MNVGLLRYSAVALAALGGLLGLALAPAPQPAAPVAAGVPAPWRNAAATGITLVRPFGASLSGALAEGVDPDTVDPIALHRRRSFGEASTPVLLLPADGTGVSGVRKGRGRGALGIEDADLDPWGGDLGADIGEGVSWGWLADEVRSLEKDRGQRFSDVQGQDLSTMQGAEASRYWNLDRIELNAPTRYDATPQQLTTPGASGRSAGRAGVRSGRDWWQE